LPAPRAFERLPRGAADVLTKARSVTEAARLLSVDRGTIHRWIKRGLIPPIGRQARLAATADPASPPASPPADSSSFAEWAHSTFELTPDEAAIVDCAQKALDMSNDSALAPAVRLGAMREYRACRRDLNLPTEELQKHGYVETETRAFPRPV
jgi:excisionase family DNA binding protein